MVAVSSVHGAQLQELRQQMEALRGGLLPAIGKVTDQARPQVQRLMGYAAIAAEYAPQISALIDTLLKRGEASVAAVSPGTGLTAHATRNRVLLTGLVIGAGLMAYDLWGDRITALVKEYRKEA